VERSGHAGVFGEEGGEVANQTGRA
jgi:hypothetical protein